MFFSDENGNALPGVIFAETPDKYLFMVGSDIISTSHPMAGGMSESWVFDLYRLATIDKTAYWQNSKDYAIVKNNRVTKIERFIKNLLPHRRTQGKAPTNRAKLGQSSSPLQQLRNNPVLPCGQSCKSCTKRKRTSAMQLELNDLRKTYLLPAPLLHRRGQGKPKTKQALAGVSITLGPGLYGLLGPNGAGKSTLIGIITGGLAADSGEVLWCGRPAHGIAFRRVLGYMPQQQGLYDSYTGRRFLAYMAALKRNSARRRAWRGRARGRGRQPDRRAR